MSHTQPPKVLELSSGPAAAFAGRLYVRLGADVVKLELLPDGDPGRRGQPAYQPTGGRAPSSVTFHFLHQGKRSVALDLDDPSAGSSLADLVAWADVAIVDEHFAGDPRIANALESSESTIRTYVTPFGSTGPYATYAGLPGAVFGMGGELFMLPGGKGYALYPDAPPLITRGSSASFDGGVIAALVSMAAMWDASSADVSIDVSEVEANLSLNRWLISHYDENGWIETRATRSYPYAGMFECADGYVMIQPSTDAHWHNVVRLMGSPDWATRPEYATRAARNEAGREIADRIAAWLKTKTKLEILESALEIGIPAAPFRDAEEVVNCVHFRHRGFFVPYGEDGDDGPLVAGIPFQLEPFGKAATGRAPDLGEHTEQVLASVGARA